MRDMRLKPYQSTIVTEAWGPPVAEGDQLWHSKFSGGDKLQCHEWFGGPSSAALDGRGDRFWGDQLCMTGHDERPDKSFKPKSTHRRVSSRKYHKQ